MLIHSPAPSEGTRTRYPAESELVHSFFDPDGPHSASGLSLKNPVDFEEVEDPLLSLRMRCKGSIASVGAGALVTSTGELMAEVDALVVVGDAGGLDCVGDRLRNAWLLVASFWPAISSLFFILWTRAKGQQYCFRMTALL